MSVVTNSALRAAPAGADGVLVTCGASAFTYGAWVEVLAATTNPAQIAGVMIHPPSGGSTWSNARLDVDVGIGIAGHEVSVDCPIPLILGNSGGQGHKTAMLPAPVRDKLPLGARVSLRTRGDAGLVSSTFAFALQYFEGLDSDHSVPYSPIAYPTAASPVTVTPNGTAWVNSTKQVLSSAVTNDTLVYGLGVYPPNTCFDYELDILIGGAGVEVVIDTLSGGTPVNGGLLEPLYLPALKLIASGTRVTVQQRWNSTSVNTFRIVLLAYDVPAAVAPPGPASDWPCRVKTPQYLGVVSVAGSNFTAAMQPLRDGASWPAPSIGGFKPPRLLEMGPISRVASDWLTGAWQAQTATMKFADFDRFYRNLSRPSLISSDAYFYAFSEATRLAEGNVTLLFHGPVVDDEDAEDLTYTCQANDYVSVDYQIFKDDKLIPQRTIEEDFPNRPASSIGFGIPIIGGTVSDEGDPTPKGAIKAINAGVMSIGGTNYVIMICAGHACAGGVIEAYDETGAALTWGSDAYAPGQSNWTTIQPSGALFFDINGNRYTFIAVLASGTLGTALIAGTSSVYFNADGMEPNADGTGTVIVDLLTLYKYLLVQHITQIYRSGSWLTGLTFPFYPGGAATTPVINESSFDAASTLSGTYLGGGFLGGFVIGANGVRQSVRDVIKAANVSCGNLLMALDENSSIAVKMFNTSRSAFLGSTRTITHRRDILNDPKFRVPKNREWFANDLGYQYAANYRDDGTGDWNGSNSQGHAPSKVKYGVKTRRETYPLVRDAATADAVGGQRLLFGGADPPRLPQWAQSLCGMAFPVLSGVPITTEFGSGANGWIDNAVWIIEQVLDPSTDKVMFKGIDVQGLVS